jgi:hypothetical protein
LLLALITSAEVTVILYHLDSPFLFNRFGENSERLKRRKINHCVATGSVADAFSLQIVILQMVNIRNAMQYKISLQHQ